MKTLIIYAHPKTKGHCPIIVEKVKDKLRKQKRKFEVVDLYGITYNPVLLEEEHYTSGNRTISNQNKKFQEKINESTHFIFIYPIWWNGMPAILKGFIDRVFTSRFAFRYARLPVVSWFIGPAPLPLLKGRRAVTFTTSGAKKWVFWLFEGRFRGIHVMTRDTLRFFGFKAKNFHLGQATQVTDQQQIRIQKLVDKGLRWLYG